jgi:hypothetical protein
MYSRWYVVRSKRFGVDDAELKAICGSSTTEASACFKADRFDLVHEADSDGISACPAAHANRDPQIRLQCRSPQILHFGASMIVRLQNLLD